jgi:hypothetical protein
MGKLFPFGFGFIPGFQILGSKRGGGILKTVKKEVRRKMHFPEKK